MKRAGAFVLGLVLAVWGSVVAARIGPEIGDIFVRWAAIYIVLHALCLVLYSKKGKEIALSIRAQYRMNPEISYIAVVAAFGVVGWFFWLGINKAFDTSPVPGIARATPPQSSSPSLQSEETSSTPSVSLRGQIEYVYATYLTDMKQTLVFALMSIKNDGAPSAAYGWKLNIKSPKWDIAEVPYIRIPEEWKIKHNGQVVATFHDSECLYEKAASPIERGQILNGWLPFIVPGDHWREIIHDHSLIRITFKDYSDRTYEASLTIEGPQIPRSLPGAETGFLRDPNVIQGQEFATGADRTARLAEDIRQSMKHENARREQLLEKLRQEYILSHDNISPALRAGTEQPPAEWLNKRLAELGETWSVTNRAASPDRQKIKDQLGMFLYQGKEIRELMNNSDLKDEAGETIANGWAKSTQEFIQENLGRSYVSRFVDDTGIPSAAPTLPMSDKKKQLWWGVYSRCYRINEFLREIPN